MCSILQQCTNNIMRHHDETDSGQRLPFRISSTPHCCKRPNPTCSVHTLPSSALHSIKQQLT